MAKICLFFYPRYIKKDFTSYNKKNKPSKWASFIRATGSDKTRSFSFRELVLSPVSTLNSNGIPGPWARATLDVSHGGNWPPEGKEFERVTRTRRQDVLLPSTRHIASRRKKNKRPRIRACTRRGGSDGLEEIEGRISSKAAANTEILPPFSSELSLFVRFRSLSVNPSRDISWMSTSLENFI